MRLHLDRPVLHLATRLETMFVFAWPVRIAISAFLVVAMADVVAPGDREPDEDRAGTHGRLSCQQSMASTQGGALS